MNDAAQGSSRPRLSRGSEKISREEWNALLAPDDSPFLEWDWLCAMEQSGQRGARHRMGSVSHPYPRASRAQNRRGLPALFEIHSMGEFVFDHGWADAADRAGIRYYPKLLVGVPFTPHTGRRLLTAPGADRPAMAAILASALVTMCDDNNLSSVHVNFCDEDEAAPLARARLSGAARLPVPLAERGLRDLRRLPGAS